MLQVLLLGVFAVFHPATPVHAQSDIAEPPIELSDNEALTQRSFEILQAVGNAANDGQADSEAIRQACSVAQEKGALAFRQALDDGALGKQQWLSELLGTGLANTLQDETINALNNSAGSQMASACALLEGGSGLSAGDDIDISRYSFSALNMAVNHGVSWLKDTGLPFMGNLEVSGSLFGNGGSNWEVLSVQPLWKSADESEHLFAQLSLNHTIDRPGYAHGDVLNAGLAYRWLSGDKRVLYGINSFLDHAFTRNHNRMSIGADIQTSELGIVMNSYIPLSGWKLVDDYTEERASHGFDVELQGRIPSLPSWQANLKAYHWSSNEAMEHTATLGYDAGLQWRPINALSWEFGLRDEQDAAAYVHSTMRFSHKLGEPMEAMWSRPLALASMQERIYDKVKRENAMRVTQRIRDSAYVTVTQTQGNNIAALAGGSTTLVVGQELPRPFVLTVDAAAGSIVRLAFRDGAILTVGAGSQVRVEARTITLITGVFQYVSGATNVTINVPGGVVNLLGTDVDVSSDGTTSTLRVRDGAALLSGSNSGNATLAAGGAAAAVNGVVGAQLASNSGTYITHTDDVSTKIDRTARGQTGDKVTPYPTQPPRLTTTSTTPGNPITIALTFNTNVSVSGTPRLVMDIGGNTRYATYASGSGTDTLSFTYTLLPADGGNNTLTVQSFDANGAALTGNGKDAITTIADTVLSLGGSVTDIVAPAGYAVAITTDPVTSSNHSAAAFQITNAEIGANFNYTITSSAGGTPVVGAGNITTATQNVTAIDVSGLYDGTLTVSLTLTDAALNTGAATTDTVNKNTTVLVLDFINGTYALNGTSYGSFTAIPGASFTRASPAVTYAETAAGTLTAFAANTPRITDKGFLIEESRTNLVERSQELDHADWLPANIAVVANASTAPDGTATAEHVSNTINLNSYIRSPDPGLANSTTYTRSVYAKAISGNGVLALESHTGAGLINARFDLLAGTLISASGGTTATITALANGWYRCTHSFTTDAAGTPSMRVYYIGSYGATNVATTIALWGAQVEQAGYASSYIPTTNATVARSADITQITPVTPWYNTPEGTILAQATYQGSQNAGGVFAFNNSSSALNNRVDLRALQNQVVVTESGVSTNLASSFADRLSHKVAISYSAARSAASRDGAMPITGVGRVPSGVDRLWIGNIDNGSHPLGGHLEQLLYFPFALSDAELQALSTP